MYVLVEGWNKQFLKRHFRNSDGVLYDGGFCKEITYPLEIMSAHQSGDRSDLAELAAAAGALAIPRGLDLRRRHELTRHAFARLDKVLDVDRFISFIAMEALLVHGDGYSMNLNNYRIYHDPESGKLVFMPHGMDQMFGSPSPIHPIPIAPPTRDLITRAVMETSEGRTRYEERVGHLYTNVYKTDLILNRLDELSARLQPWLTQENVLQSHIQAVADLSRRIVARGNSVQEQLGKLHRLPLNSSRTGEAKLAGWTRQMGRSKAHYTQERAKDGHKLLKVALQGSGHGSWRTQVLLEPGEYHFSGKAKVQGFAIDSSDPQSGVGLRLSGYQLDNRLLSDADWTAIDYVFDVKGTATIELICEINGLQGEATFDSNSLRLRRK